MHVATAHILSDVAIEIHAASTHARSETYIQPDSTLPIMVHFAMLLVMLEAWYDRFVCYKSDTCTDKYAVLHLCRRRYLPRLL